MRIRPGDKLSDFREDVAEILRNGELHGQPEWKIAMVAAKLIDILMRMGVCIKDPDGTIRTTRAAMCPEVWQNLIEIAKEEGLFDALA